MKIIINRVLGEGLVLEEEASAAQLDLETDLIKFSSGVKLKARVWQITNTLSVELNIAATILMPCSRCLEEFEWGFNKDIRLNYPLDSSTTFIDLNPEIREELILEYPIKPLCGLNCKGLCVKCGKNKNKGGCNCGST